ncbi:hypothetical protein FPV67DRAFT_1168895 [Lyophyllum atratum]|nr:hypothetical protein FPV67DRAFT_1168895 [Lyophyllum atratum]
MLKVREGSQPSRPSPDSPAWGPWGLTEDVWSLMQQCWNADPKERPNILDIVTKHSATILVDDRPLDIQSVISPAHFRDSVGGRAELLSDADVAAILDGIDSTSEDETPLPASSMSS